MNKPMRFSLVAAGVGFLLSGGVAAAQEAVRVREAIERVEGCQTAPKD